MRHKHLLLSAGLKGSGAMLIVLALGACQANGPKMSIEAARKIAADFKVTNFVAPPRTINDLRTKFQNGKALPDSCESVWTDRKEHIADILRRLNSATRKSSIDLNAASLVVQAENTVTTGRFDLALSYIHKAFNRLPNRRHKVRQAIFSTQLSRLYARLGDLDSAKSQFSASMGYWTDASAGGRDWLNSQKGLIYTNAGRAAVARLSGDLPLAEYHFRQAIKESQYGSLSSYSHINIHELRAQLAQVILQQRRTMEARAEARNAIQKLGIVDPNSHNYNGHGAEPVSVMAAILLEQGDVEDSEYLARIAVNMHEASCSEPQSLGITEARRIWIDSLAEQGNWSGVLDQVNQARLTLKNYEELFDRQFGTSLAYIEAELNVGNVDLGRSLAEGMMETARKEHGPDSYRAAEIEGILAMAETRLGHNQSAAVRFAKAMPILVSGDLGGETAVSGRRERLLQGYMDLLVKVAKSGQTLVANLDVPGELLRLSSARRLGRVQQAVSAGAIRAAAGNPELSRMVRQEQDLTEEARALGETLDYVQSAPEATSKVASFTELQGRLSAIDLARRTLRAEILKRFPDYAELVAPKPMSVSEIRQRMSPGQAVLSFHVADKTTYVWAMPSGGKLVFTEVKISRDELREKVDRLREAVDPGQLQTLEDIPDFDVELAHELYSLLLKPVQAGWEKASEILVVADGPLGALPFSMLATAPEVSLSNNDALFDRYRGVSWLVKQVAVTSLPSVNALKNSTAKQTKLKLKPKRRPFVGFGDPFFSAQQALGSTSTEIASRGFSLRAAPKTRSVTSADLALLPRLPDTRDEILAIARAVGADPTRDLYLGKNASEQSVKTNDLSSYDVISFATHGLIPGDLNGLDEPALALSSPSVTGDKDDGLLTMNEILSLKLNAEFAVLSACNTASADGAGAEAVSGLGRAFFYAGAKALLVSNWPVNSASTTDLMSRMFRALANDNTLKRTEALRQVKLYQIMEGGYKSDGKLQFSYAHPIFWAPFSIVGDGGRKS